MVNLNRKGRETQQAIERELEEWPGAGVEFADGKKHPRAKLSFDGRMQTISFSSTPSSPRSLHHTIADMRRTLRNLGAERTKPEPSAAEEIKSYTPPNDGKARRPSPVPAEKAKPEPDIVDQLAEAGLADEAAVEKAREAKGAVLNPKAAVNLARTRPDIDVPLRVRVRDGVERDGWGLYTDIEAADYHFDPCPEPSISNSLMDPLLNKTPRDFAWSHPRRTELVPEWPEEDEEKIVDKVAMIQGDVVHQLALGKGRGFDVGDFDSFRTKAARDWRDGVMEDGLTPILRHVFEEAQPLADMIKEQIKVALDGADYETEVVGMYQEMTPFGPVWVRIMMDVWCPERAMILDPKVTKRLYDGTVETHAVNMGWDRQAALYPHAVGQIVPELAGRIEFWDLMINPEPPFVHRLWGPERMWDATSVRQCQRAIDIFAQCMQSGEWPGYPNRTRGPMPGWEEKKRMEQEGAA